jgi:hypothetical protein
MGKFTDVNRRRLVALGKSSTGSPSDPLPDGLVLESCEAMRAAFEDHGYSGKFFLSAKPGSSGWMNLLQEARWFVSASRTADPDDLVTLLDELVERNEARVFRIAAVWGVHPDREIRLAEGFKLVPLANLPSSNFRDTCMGNTGAEPPKAMANRWPTHKRRAS